MHLYIKIENGQPINHPSLAENLIASFGKIPEGWEPFVRAQPPSLELYEALESATAIYKKVGGVWQDVWVTRPMTAEEIEEVNAKQQDRMRIVRDFWGSLPDAFNFTAWVLDEATLRMVPPIPRPVEEGKIFRWSGADNNWKEAPAQPEAGGPYKFDFAQWTWVSA
jgi:hypothetical protein